MAEPDNQSGDSAPKTRGDLLATLLMMGAALAAIGGFGVLFSMWWRTGVSNDYEVLRIASQEFVSGRPVVAGELAETVVFEEDAELTDETEEAVDLEADESEETPEMKAAREAREERLGWIRLRDFLVGVGKVARAHEQDDLRERRRYLYEAVPFLESSREGGFPPGRQTEGHRILGQSLFSLGRYDDAIVELETAINRDPTLRRDLLPIMAEAQLSSISPSTAQSLQTIETFLSDATLQPEQRWQGDLIRLRALIELKDWNEVERTITRVLQAPPSTDLELQSQQAEFRDHVQLLRAVAQVRQTIDRYGDRPADQYEDRSPVIAELVGTVQDLRRIQREASPKIAARARLWAARALLVQGAYDDALTELTAVRQQRPFGGEAIIGGLEEIELLAEQGRGGEVLLTTRYMMRELGDARGFDASMITFEEFQRRLAGAIEQLRRKGEFESAIDTSRSLPPVFELSEALTQEGISYSQWAADTIADGTDIGGSVARSASVLARARYRAAGDAFAEAAKLQFKTEEYVATLWSAIDAYQKGRHFSKSIRLLEPYLRYEERRRQPRGLVAFGRALLAEDQPDKAIEALTSCIVEFPRDPLRYDARLLAALAHAEKGDLDNARVLLTDNLQDGELTPQSPAWRDSLLTLGELLYQRGYRDFLIAEQAEENERLQLLRDNQPILEEAVRYLDEAVARYWPIPRAEAAAYLSARAHVMSSQWPRIESKSAGILDAARRALRTQADQELQTALDGFSTLRKHLSTREEDQRLPEGEQAMLRNCFLAEADVLREMDQIDEATQAYRAVELRYMNEPPALEALLGRASCAKIQGRPQEADKLVRQASVVLGRIPQEWNGRFEETTRYDRDGWETYLGWMNQRIGANAGGVGA